MTQMLLNKIYILKLDSKNMTRNWVRRLNSILDRLKNKKYRAPKTYEVNDKNYLRVGSYGTDDLEYIVQSDGSIYLPEIEKYYSNINQAYITENELWVEQIGA